MNSDPALSGVADDLKDGPSSLVIVIVILMVVATLKLAATVVLPVVIAVLLTLTLSAPVRWLQKKGIRERVGAAIVVFGALGVGVSGAAMLATPALEWVAAAPKTMEKLGARVRHLTLPFTRLQASADQIQQSTGPGADKNTPKTVLLASPGLFARIARTAIAAIPVMLTVVFLTFFLLASGPLFRKKLASLLPGRTELTRREHLLGAIEVAASHFLITVALVNLTVGVLTALALWALGVPSPVLWGGIAAILNFVPYLGPVVSAAIITLAALAGVDDVGRAMIGPAVFVVIHLIETNYVTPTLLGRHLPLNTVAIFLGLLLFGWLWGIPGAVLAVPLTVCAKLVCDHVPALAHVGELLDN